MATHRVAISSWALDHKIPPGSPDWRGFNASFVNRDVTAFDLARQVYDGHAFTTWHKDNWRTTANYLCGQHLGLDFDHGLLAGLDLRFKLCNTIQQLDPFARVHG